MATINATISISSDISSYPTSTNKANFFYVAYNASAAAAGTAETIGKLYGGDWMLMPYNGSTDINVASNTTDIQYLEYMVFADGVVAAAG